MRLFVVVAIGVAAVAVLWFWRRRRRRLLSQPQLMAYPCCHNGTWRIEKARPPAG